MDGRIWVSSQEGKGSEFSFVITLKVAANEESHLRPSHDFVSRDLHGLRVLVVEDSLSNQELIKAYFEAAGCRGDYAFNGQEAVDRLRQDRDYDVCLMDVQMPIMDGLAATRIIRQEISKDLPIIALTAGVMKDDIDHCFSAGMNAYLSKPLDFNVLLEKIWFYKRHIEGVF